MAWSLQCSCHLRQFAGWNIAFYSAADDVEAMAAGINHRTMNESWKITKNHEETILLVTNKTARNQATERRVTRTDISLWSVNKSSRLNGLRVLLRHRANKPKGIRLLETLLLSRSFEVRSAAEIKLGFWRLSDVRHHRSMEVAWRDRVRLAA